MRHISFVFAVFATVAHASPLEDCLASSQTYAVGCYAEEMTRQELALEAHYRRALQAIKFDEAHIQDGWSKEQIHEQRKYFSLSQTRWKQFMEARCRHWSSTMNGTGAAGVYVDCKTKMIIDRLKDISE